MVARPQPVSYSRTVVRRVREIRQQRGWTAQHLADLLTAAGCATSRAMVAGLEAGKREHVTVDELYAFSRVLGVPVDRLAHDDPACPACSDRPPDGFRCLACGGSRPAIV